MTMQKQGLFFCFFIDDFKVYSCSIYPPIITDIIKKRKEPENPMKSTFSALRNFKQKSPHIVIM